MAPAKTPTESKTWLPLLLALMAALAGLVLWDRQSGDGPAVVRAADKSSPRAQAAARTEQSINPLANLTLDKLHDTVRRPLFETSRRPVEAPAPLLPPPQTGLVAPPVVDQNALSLLGVVASEGRAIALIKRNQTGQNVRVRGGRRGRRLDHREHRAATRHDPAGGHADRVAAFPQEILAVRWRKACSLRRHIVAAPEHGPGAHRAGALFVKRCASTSSQAGCTETTRAENVAGGASVPRSVGQRSARAGRARRARARIDASNGWRDASGIGAGL